jgi:hypothetical protein
MTLESQRKILLGFQKWRVPIVVVGGHAVVFHGHVRTTADVDVVWLRSPEAEQSLAGALSEMKACWLSDEIDPATGAERLVPVTAAYIQANHLMMLETQWGFLDLFDYVPGAAGADVASFFGESIQAGDGLRYPSLDWVRRMKKAAGRVKDLADLEELARLHQ